MCAARGFPHAAHRRHRRIRPDAVARRAGPVHRAAGRAPRRLVRHPPRRPGVAGATPTRARGRQQDGGLEQGPQRRGDHAGLGEAVVALVLLHRRGGAGLEDPGDRETGCVGGVQPPLQPPYGGGGGAELQQRRRATGRAARPRPAAPIVPPAGSRDRRAVPADRGGHLGVVHAVDGPASSACAFSRHWAASPGRRWSPARRVGVARVVVRATPPQCCGLAGRTVEPRPRSTQLLSMLIVTPPYVSLCPPRYWCTRRCGVQPSLRTYVEPVSARPFQSAIQSWSGIT